MRIAAFADVHANLSALDAVLEAIEQESVDSIVCLGDLVGYNADPGQCIDRIREHADVVVAGNHDRTAVFGDGAFGTNRLARVVNEWTHGQLQETQRIYLDGLPGRHLERDAFIAVHGCFLNETHVNGYVTSTMLGDNLAAVADRVAWPRLALCGHTHQPMCGWLDHDGVAESEPAAQVRWPARARVALVNPGSVGQPRDGDPRASFAVIDLALRSVSFRRVAYDIDHTADAIRRAGLPDILALRLREGR